MTKYTVKDDGKGNYEVTEQPEESTDELIAEAKALFRKPNITPVKTKKELELERSTKQWNEYYRNNPSKIRYNIFEEIERAFDY
jgi:hypothetical protein